VEMNDLEISTLVAKGYLPEEARSDGKAIKSAIEAVISDLVFDLEQQVLGRADLARETFGKTIMEKS
jgi:hypothetical protein